MTMFGKWSLYNLAAVCFLLPDKAAHILQMLTMKQDKRYELTPKTTIDEFMSIMQADRRTAKFDPDSLTLIFERLHQKVVRRSEDDKHQAERHQRRALEDLRSKIKRLDPPVSVSDTWDQVRPRVEKLEEYRVLDSDELARSAFEKVIRRLKEKSEEQGKDRRDRDRDRDHRNGHGKRLRTRTPETDAYEADRRKAQAARERNYGKRGASGLSPPPPRARDRDDRYDGRAKVSTLSHYERERRERESERERTYTSRADPRDRTSELDYGDSRPGSMRRRRESDVDSARDVRDPKVRITPNF
jgi:pre-mRNA-processing factor 40